MKIMLATLALNEMEWLPLLYQQHKDWPGLVGWVFVEACDCAYYRVNRDLTNGMSIDGTSQFLENLAKTDPHVTYRPVGLLSTLDSPNHNPTQVKCAARNHYMEVADRLEPDYIVILDADEFYPHEQQARLNSIFTYQPRESYILRRREIWCPPSLSPRIPMAHEVIGGFWAIPHLRAFKWSKGMCYGSNHNIPDGLNRRPYETGEVQYCHMGWASSLASRQAKRRYYAERGEGVTDHRAWYQQSREAWETWKPGDTLPQGAQVVPYSGPIPEVFR